MKTMHCRSSWLVRGALAFAVCVLLSCAQPFAAHAADQPDDGAGATVLSIGSGADSSSAQGVGSSTEQGAVASAKAGGAWKRVQGRTALDTMAAVAREGWKKSDVVVIASFDSFKDALSASPLAGKFKAPVLYSYRSSLPTQTEKEIKRLGAKTAYIVGGTKVVSKEVESQLKKAGCKEVKRVWGQTSVGTSVAVANQLKGSRSGTAIIVSNASYRDILSVSPYAYKTVSAIYYVNGGAALSADVKRSIANGGYSRVLIVGGPLAVKSEVVYQVRDLGISDVVRMWGQNAVGTSSKMAEWSVLQGMSPARVGVASSGSFRDALVGAALCGKNNAPIVLIGDGNRSVVYSFLNKHRAKISGGYIFGGPKAVSTASEGYVTKGTTKAAYKNMEGYDVTGFTKLGIDVSQWQGTIDWRKVKASGIDFAIVRVAHGVGANGVVDTQHVRNLREAKAAGVQLGVYIYSDAGTTSQAKREAEKVVSLLKAAGVRASDLPFGVYYDLEEQWLQEERYRPLLLNMTRSFMHTMQANGFTNLGVYSNLYWWTSFLPSEEYNQWNRWMAQWASKCTYFGAYKLWQFRSTGSVPGINGPVDMDLAY